MKPIKLFLYLIFLLPTCTFSQTSQFEAGQSDFNLGIGFVSTIKAALEADGFQVQTATPPISLTADFATGDHFALGGYVGIAKENLTYTQYDYWGYYSTVTGSISHFILGIRGTYHFEISSDFDAYAGLMLGYNSFKAHIENIPVNISGFTYNLLVGGRYHFSQNFGAFMELGYGVTVVNLGITLKCGGVQGSKSNHTSDNGHRRIKDDD
jgi:hypothetical protein